ncbi:uncharacterized protein N7482_001200 [Penicillium canariense]|uniref:Mediator complex subunit 27 n=1 Tax=Penicillium canariense TaxID=189055 RepID=A0A9W9LSQ4_9EURO|nr:uncharacterized protein N7482_001200 [Penicillium canariense]KAJ5175323.1 hypothetical protein N7482_001200 [Penicillium canariense]
MSAVPTTAAPAAPGTLTAIATPQVNSATQGAPQAANGDTPPLDWESEIQLVSSLAKLQELERKIHELRQLVPGKLLEPLQSLTNPKWGPQGSSFADSPVQLREGLEQAARTQLANIENFKSMWQGPELQPVWAHVESRLKDSAGQIVQPTGMWERDYDVLLEELLKVERGKDEELLREDEEAERAKAQSSEGEWQGVVESFIQRNLPGVRVIKEQETLSLAIALVKAGVIFHVAGVKEPDAPGVADWHVSSRAPPGRVPTKLENSMTECLNSRPRKWDLAFLLDMISSYADLKQTSCVKCNKLTNNSAQLPTIRRAQSTQPSQGEPRTFAFDALHSSCV